MYRRSFNQLCFTFLVTARIAVAATVTDNDAQSKAQPSAQSNPDFENYTDDDNAVIPTSANAVKNKVNKPSNSEKRDATSAQIEYDEPTKEPSENLDAHPIERLFRNPVFANGLTSGADAINHSIDNLMSSLFYSLLNNRLKFPITPSSNVNLNLTRDVFNARSGAYVVVDRFGLGPDFSRQIYQYNGIPVTLGAQGSADVYDIYLRSDPMRISDNKTLPWWRSTVNNWFGILPILEAILPPSFNANEMYDPLKRIEAPFKFPLSVDAVYMMEIGSIKSYAISGGVSLAIETSDAVHGFKDQIVSGNSALDVTLPITIFRTGEYRINILRKDTNTVWVGLMDTNQIGQRFETNIGKTFYLISQTIPLWKGMPAPMLPIDFSAEDSIQDLFGRVYSFDLREEEAKTAYLEAVHGNFAPAQLSFLRHQDEKKTTGVEFFYTKKEKRYQTAIKTGHNIFLKRKGTLRTHSDAEIEITDVKGRYFILEAKEDSDLTLWNMLTGSTESKITLQSDLMVKKVIESDDTLEPHKSKYEFLATGNPIDTTFSLSISDRFVETEDLIKYLDQLSRFTILKFDDLPTFETRDPVELARRRKEVVLLHDNMPNHRLQVTPTHLGRFEGYASVRITYDQLLQAASLPEATLWNGFCKSFKLSPHEQCPDWQQSRFWRRFYQTLSYIALPIRMVDFHWMKGDAIDEIEYSVDALKEFSTQKTPEEKQSALRKFFATAYPIERVNGLLLMANLSEIPRSVELEAEPKGNASDDIKDRFKKINARRFLSDKPFPPAARFDTTKDVENKFDPANLTFIGAKPQIKKLTLYKEAPSKILPKSPNEDEDEIPLLVTKISASKIFGSDHLRVYAKLEQSGRIQLAKLKLFEEVVDIPMLDDLATASPDRANFLLRLSGPQSVLASLISEEAISSGGEFKLTLAISGNGLIWSDSKYLEFRIEDGKLLAK